MYDSPCLTGRYITAVTTQRWISILRQKLFVIFHRTVSKKACYLLHTQPYFFESYIYALCLRWLVSTARIGKNESLIDHVVWSLPKDATINHWFKSLLRTCLINVDFRMEETLFDNQSSSSNYCCRFLNSTVTKSPSLPYSKRLATQYYAKTKRYLGNKSCFPKKEE